MTREDVRKLFPDATDDQITGLLNQSNSEIAREKAKTEKLKSDFKELQGYKDQNELLQQKIAEMEQEGLSEVEKLRKTLEESTQEIARLKKNELINNQRSEAVSNFKITGEQAKEVVKDDGTFDMVKLGQIIAEKEQASALAKEKELGAASSNPGGGQGGISENGQTLAEEKARSLARKSNGVNQDILNNYRR